MCAQLGDTNAKAYGASTARFQSFYRRCFALNALSIDHVLITRFNVPTPGREGLIRAKDGWLKDRVCLFERFCLPSVESQTLQEFHWLIYFDPDSPQWLKDWLEEKRSSPRFTAIFRPSVSREELVSDLMRISGGRREVLLTTNLDNDDGLAIDFVQRLQNSISSSTRTAIYLGQGLIVHGTSSYLRSDPHNAFCSVAEPWKEPLTAWADWHNRLGLVMPVRVLAGPPGWLQIIHARNVSNTVHGKRCNPAPYTHLFPYAVRGLAKPSPQQLVAENLVISPLRSLRQLLRSAIKTAVINVVGKSNFDALKNTAAVIAGRTSVRSSQTKNSRKSEAA